MSELAAHFKGAWMISAKRRIKGHVLVSAVLVVGLIISCIAMEAAFSSGDRQLTRLYAVCCAILCVASSLSIFLHAVRYVERKKLERKRECVRVSNDDRDFIAKYSPKDRIVLSILTVSFALLMLFAYAHSGHYWFKILISGIFLFCAVAVYRYFFTTIWFTDKLILVEVKLFTKYSESYGSVTAMRAQPGNLRIQFADGKNLNLPSGLGDSARIAAILEKHVEIWPDSGTFEKKSARP